MSANELHIPFVGPGEVLAAGIILPMVGCCVVALRLWLRSIQKTKVGPDDYTIAMSLVRTHEWFPYSFKLFVMGMGICVVYGKFPY
ncbi:hypothetical protein HYFRA_00000563 [Hymenoscyphus fraxineus]|uniref:Uncharacterized protein n=1 Tax=Hymenoscyphus fraxineus TaxID=746836 RepID=A0A9N9L116_9HELO|nr:hypothetical protein HYFRA_00000563 [Hymenoscyphus fraxineus]